MELNEYLIRDLLSLENSSKEIKANLESMVQSFNKSFFVSGLSNFTPTTLTTKSNILSVFLSLP